MIISMYDINNIILRDFRSLKIMTFALFIVNIIISVNYILGMLRLLQLYTPSISILYLK